MKKLFLSAIVLLISTITNAQTIGDHLNDVKTLKPVGTFDSASKPYTYSVTEESVSSLMMYFFNDDLICDKLVIAPLNSSSRQRWIASFNDNWVSINNTTWRFYKDDGMILIVTMEYVNSAGMIFLIKEDK